MVGDEVLQLLVLGQRHLQPITGEHGVTRPTVDQSEDSIAVSHHVAEVELGVERGVGLLVEAVPGALPLKPLVHFSGLLEQEFKNYCSNI